MLRRERRTKKYGGAGDRRTQFNQPSCQRAAVPPAIANGHRATPDIATDGDPQTGMLVGETQTFPDGTVRYGSTGSIDASDGTTPILRSLDDEAQSLHVGSGWDNLTGTGTGSPRGEAFVRGLGRR